MIWSIFKLAWTCGLNQHTVRLLNGALKSGESESVRKRLEVCGVCAVNSILSGLSLSTIAKIVPIQISLEVRTWNQESLLKP